MRDITMRLFALTLVGLSTLSVVGRDFRAEGINGTYVGFLTVRPGTSPAQLDFTIETCGCNLEGKTAKAIYREEDGAIVYAATALEDPRPAAFTGLDETRVLIERATRLATKPTGATQICGELAAFARKTPTLDVKESAGTIDDARTGTRHEGCRVDVSAKRIDDPDAAPWPHDRLRARLVSEGWQEDLQRAADGAGSTAFALRRDPVLCLLSAEWIGGDPPGTAPSVEAYRLEIGCFEGDDG